MIEFRMPSLGADMEAGTLVHWLIKPGDTVHRGDLVAEIETQKGVIDVEIFDTGTVTDILVPEGAHVPVGTPLAVIVEPASAASSPEPAIAPAPMPEPQLVTTVPAKTTTPVEPKQVTTRENGRHRTRATPAARSRAREIGIDLAALTGTGPGQAITLTDVEGAAASGAQSVKPTTGDAQAAMKSAIATTMARSKREIPHYYLSTDIDMQRSIDWLAEENDRRSVEDRIVSAALLLKAVALACRDVPEMNGFWRDGAFTPGDGVHIGVAVALRGGGLVNPAIHDVDQLSLSDLMAALRDVVTRARSGKLRSSEISDATITVTNLGDQGVNSVTGVIYPPQVALVGFGRITDRPQAVDGLLGIRPIVTTTLSADHRASVGHRGAIFLTAIDRLLQQPETLQ